MTSKIMIEDVEIVPFTNDDSRGGAVGAWLREDTYRRALPNGDFTVITDIEDLKLWAEGEYAKNVKVIYLDERLIANVVGAND
jgi:hypothetical protein